MRELFKRVEFQIVVLIAVMSIGYNVYAQDCPMCPTPAECPNPLCECDPCSCGPDCACDGTVCACPGCAVSPADTVYKTFDGYNKQKAIQCLALLRGCDTAYSALARKAQKHKNRAAMTTAQTLKPKYMICKALLEQCSQNALAAQLKFSGAPGDEVKLRAAADLAANMRNWTQVEGILNEILKELGIINRSIGTIGA